MTYYDAFSFCDGRTLLADKSNNEFDFCEEMKVIEYLTNMDDGSLYLKVEIMLEDGSSRTFIIPRNELSGKVYETLIANGLSVSKVHEYVITLIEILFETEKTAPKGFCHSALGYKNINGELAYFTDCALCSATPSTYIGKVPLEQRGTFESWRAGFSDIITTHPEQLLVLAMGASAPLVARLEECGVLTESLLLALIGLTSKGKSTSLSAAASVWSRAGTKGLVDSIGGSENYLYASLGNKVGFPHFIDESTVYKKDTASLLYKLAAGREGGKCQPDGTPRKERMWSTTVIFTGEVSLLHSTSNGGLHARLIEFDLDWTHSAEVSDFIYEHVARNYGTAHLPLIQEISRFSDDGLVRFYKCCIADLTKKFKPSSGVEIRITKKLAVLMLSAYIAANAWGFKVRKRDLCRLLKQTYIHNVPKIDKIDECYRKLKEYVVQNSSLFPPESTKSFGSKLLGNPSCNGVISTRNYKPCVWMLNTVFEKILHENGLDASRAVLKELCARGMIEHFGDRYRKLHNINGIDVLCVCVFLTANVSSHPKKQVKKSVISKVNLLLDDE